MRKKIKNTKLDDYFDIFILFQVMENPYPLRRNAGKSFQGSIVLGKGFVVTKEQAAGLIAKDPRNKDVLFPYLNGDDLNNNPDQSPSRWVINFFDWPEEKARTYPDCFEIVERLVKSERTRWKKDKVGNEIVGTYALRKPLPQKWWIHGEKRPALYRAISKVDQVMVINNHTRHHVFGICSGDVIFSHALTVITNIELAPFLTSIFCNIWAWKYASTMGSSTLRYTSSSVFETYPFPTYTKERWGKMQIVCNSVYELRNELMSENQIGLTKLYNCFHSNNYCSQDLAQGVKQLRELQITLDNIILECYGWNDINLEYDFYELDYLPENDQLRYTIHPQVQKQILDRLLKLNMMYYTSETEIADEI